MPILVINALLSSLFAVRVFKGPWLRNPQYLVIAIVGCAVGMLGLEAFEPGLSEDFIFGNLSAIVGAFVAITLFDRVMKTA